MSNVLFAGEALASISYEDLHSGDPFYTEVEYLVDLGALGGYSTAPPCSTSGVSCFKPSDKATRGQLSKIITIAVSWQLYAYYQHFTDVPSSNTFYYYVETAYNHGVIGGYACGGTNPETGSYEPCDLSNRPYFRPFNKVTRGQTAKIVVLSAGLNVIQPSSATFIDVTFGSAFYDYVETAIAHGIVGGYACGGTNPEPPPYISASEPCDSQNRPYFRPYNNITRGQIAKVVFRGTAIRRVFAHSSSYRGSNNITCAASSDCSSVTCVSPSSYTPPGSLSGTNDDYSTFKTFRVVGQEIGFHSDSISYLQCVWGNTGGLRAAIAFTAVQQSNAVCAVGSFSAESTNLPGNLRLALGPVCNPFGTYNETRIVVDDPSHLTTNPGTYYASAVWNSSQSTGYTGEVRISNLHVDGGDPSNDPVVRDLMTKLCYTQGNGSPTNSKYGMYICP